MKKADNPDFIFWQPPPPEGRWVIGGNFHVQVAKKPNWFHEIFTRLLLGWVWEDGEIK